MHFLLKLGLALCGAPLLASRREKGAFAAALGTCPPGCLDDKLKTCDDVLTANPSVTCKLLEDAGCDCSGCTKCDAPEAVMDEPAGDMCKKGCLSPAATCNDHIKRTGVECDTLIQAGCDCAGCSLCDSLPFDSANATATSPGAGDAEDPGPGPANDDGGWAKPSLDDTDVVKPLASPEGSDSALTAAGAANATDANKTAVADAAAPPAAAAGDTAPPAVAAAAAAGGCDVDCGGLTCAAILESNPNWQCSYIKSALGCDCTQCAACPPEAAAAAAEEKSPLGASASAASAENGAASTAGAAASPGAAAAAKALAPAATCKAGCLDADKTCDDHIRKTPSLTCDILKDAGCDCSGCSACAPSAENATAAATAAATTVASPAVPSGATAAAAAAAAAVLPPAATTTTTTTTTTTPATKASDAAGAAAGSAAATAAVPAAAATAAAGVCAKGCLSPEMTCDDQVNDVVTCPVLAQLGCDCTGCSKCAAADGADAAATCKPGCLGNDKTCEDYVAQGITCEQLTAAGCDCGGCASCAEKPAKVCKPGCMGSATATCNDMVRSMHASCAALSAAGCDCEGCSECEAEAS